MHKTYGKLNSLTEARKLLGGIGASTLYDWIAAGHIQAIKIGGTRFITDAEIERVLHDANQAAAEKAAAARTKQPRRAMA